MCKFISKQTLLIFMIINLNKKFKRNITTYFRLSFMLRIIFDVMWHNSCKQALNFRKHLQFLLWLRYFGAGYLIERPNSAYRLQYVKITVNPAKYQIKFRKLNLYKELFIISLALIKVKPWAYSQPEKGRNSWFVVN